jgi:hypothetical protein
MGYLKIPNLYKEQDILLLKECYALEKLHGTSCHIVMSLKEDGNAKIGFFAGGVSHANFVKLFDTKKLKTRFLELGFVNLVIFGEGIGGKCQGMKDTYGSDLRFVAFDVKVGDVWVSVPDMSSIVKSFDLDVVSFVAIPTDMNSIDVERDKFSVQAEKCGCGSNKLREGVVLRPLIELRKNNGKRIIAKHKGEAFAERVHTPKVQETDPDKLQVLVDAAEVADEWVTSMRLVHVLDKLEWSDMGDTRKVIDAMVEDVRIEGKGEIEWSRLVDKAIANKAAKMFKQHLMDKLKE